MDFVDQMFESMPLVVFLVTGTVAVASSVLVVALRNPVHSALFLMLAFLCVAVLFFLVGAEFVGAVQILVYAGGIMVLFLFAVMLVNVRGLPEERVFSPYWKGALAIGFAIFVVFASVVRTGNFGAPVDDPTALGRRTVRIAEKVSQPDGKVVTKRRTEVRSTNSETVGMSLYQDYVVPFEVASVFLLVAMIGAIVIGKRELLGGSEESREYMVDRVEQERDVKKEEARA